MKQNTSQTCEFEYTNCIICFDYDCLLFTLGQYIPPQEAHSQPQTESFFDPHHQYPQMVPNIKTEMPWSQHDYPGCRDMNGTWSPTDLRTNMSRAGYHPLHNIGELGGHGLEGKPMIQAAALAGYSGKQNCIVSPV